jgi:hypothetical protein
LKRAHSSSKTYVVAHPARTLQLVDPDDETFSLLLVAIGHALAEHDLPAVGLPRRMRCDVAFGIEERTQWRRVEDVVELLVVPASLADSSEIWSMAEAHAAGDLKSKLTDPGA